MSHPVFFKTSTSIAVISLLEVVLPSILIVGSLFVVTLGQGIAFDQFFVALAIISGAFSLVLLQPRRSTRPLYLMRPVAVALQILLRWLVLVGLLMAIGYIAGFSSAYPRHVILPWIFGGPLLVFAATLGLSSVLRRIMLSRQNLRTAVIAGFNDVAQRLGQRLADHPELCTQVLGYFDDRSQQRLGLDETKRLGPLSDMADYVRQHHVDVIFVALPIRHIQRVKDLLDDLRDSTASIYYLPDIFVFDLIQSSVSEIVDIPIVAMCETPFHGYRGVVKRSVDLGLSLGILTVTSPFMLAIAALIKFTSAGPVIFRQRRYGLDGKEIIVYKFRTMYVTEDGPAVPQATKDDPRVTKVGRILRRYSLDELPQLFNVVEGTMSLVGPRPHAVAHNEEYRKLIKGYMIRYKVLPGITGLAQVNGCRGETSKVEEMRARIDYDLEYLRNWTPLLDVKIVLLTPFKLLNDKKAY